MLGEGAENANQPQINIPNVNQQNLLSELNVNTVESIYLSSDDAMLDESIVLNESAENIMQPQINIPYVNHQNLPNGINVDTVESIALQSGGSVLDESIVLNESVENVNQLHLNRPNNDLLKSLNNLLESLENIERSNAQKENDNDFVILGNHMGENADNINYLQQNMQNNDPQKLLNDLLGSWENLEISNTQNENVNDFVILDNHMGESAENINQGLPNNDPQKLLNDLLGSWENLERSNAQNENVNDFVLLDNHMEESAENINQGLQYIPNANQHNVFNMLRDNRERVEWSGSLNNICNEECKSTNETFHVIKYNSF